MLITLISAGMGSLICLLLRVTGAGGEFPRPLSAAQEKECLARMTQGDETARATLIEHNLRLVAHIVKKYYANSQDQDDLLSIGTIGLIKGISSFNPEKNTRLATYAARCIENEILMYFRAGKKRNNEVSLNEPIDTDKDGNALTLVDIICCEDNALEQIETRDRNAMITRFLITCLDGRERSILIYRYGLNGAAPLTQREIAQKFGISRSYVSRLESKALARLREEVEKSQL